MIKEKKVLFGHNVKANDPGYKLKKLDNSELPSYIIENYEKYKKWFDY